MIKTSTYLTSLTLLVMLFTFGVTLQGQTDSITIKGVVVESGTGLPLHQVSVSVFSNGVSSETDEKGTFSIIVPDKQAELIFNLPGYTKRNVFPHGKDSIEVSLVADPYVSVDKSIHTPLGNRVIKDENFAVASVTEAVLDMSVATSFDQVLQGRVAGLSVVEQSGMPGHKTYMNIRGVNSIYGKSEPLVFIDGMIHDYTYATNSLVEGYSLNPFDIVDIDDITDITVLKDGTSFLGAAGSNGVLNINTEQESEASTIIKFKAYGGIALAPAAQDVLDGPQFNNYLEQISEEGFTPPAQDDYRYNNNTDWQDNILKPGALQKYHFFLKGGDEIATYNISTGYLKQEGIIDESSYNRFNLRINGKINITNKLAIVPNVKLSLANSYTPNLGISDWKNPLTSSLLKPSIMTPYARDAATGTTLNYLDDVGVFNVSNPVAIVKNAASTGVSYNFLSSLKALYDFNEHLQVFTLIGIDFNNSHEDIFLPDNGMVQVDSIQNSPGYFINEFQSLQNHTGVTYKNKTSSGHSYTLQGGFRYLKNTYKYNLVTDVNTPSDEFRSVGLGGKYTYLRTSQGDYRGLTWVSYFGNLNYNFRNKYFFQANVSYDGNSAANEKNTYNFYPSLAAAWQPIPLVKLRGSWSVTGNMFSTIYDNSTLYYTSQRWNNIGVLNREGIANEEMEVEKKTTLNAGVDVSLFRQLVNVHVDVYQSNVDNLLIHQTLGPTFGFTDYINNGGKLQTTGLEIAADTRVNLGPVAWTVGATFTNQTTVIKSLDLLNPEQESIVTPIEGGEMITSVDNAINAFYGYKTNGIYNNTSDANKVTGPNGLPMEAGDVRFVDTDGNNSIDEADKMIIGDPNPDFFGGIYTAFGFKNFEFSALFNYSVGNDIFNYLRYRSESMDTYSNQSTSVLDRWTESNTNASFPRASIGDPTGNTAFSDRWIEDGSFVRLKQIRLSYKLPQFFGLRGFTVYTTATNVLTFTKYKGYDPEFQYGNNPFYMGVDYGQMPQPKSFIVGVKVDL